MNLLRAVSTIGGLTLVSRVLGMVRDMLMARYVGAGMASDAFLIAWRLPNLFRALFAEGAFAAVFVPMFNRKLAEAWINYTLEPQMSGALTERQGLSNTLEASPFMQDGARLIWLQQVEDPGARARLWDCILSGDRPEKF